MKIRNLISTLCAVAMLVSSASAFAVEPEVKLSEYAGKTMKVLVAADDREGDKVIEVVIPANATVEEQQALVDNAAYTAMYGKRSAKTVANSGELNFAYSSLTFSAGAKEWARVGPLSQSYSKVKISIGNVKVSGGAKQLNVRLTNDTAASAPGARWLAALEDNMDVYVWFTSGEYLNGGRAYLDQGETLHFWSYTDAGSVTCSVAVLGLD